MSINNHPVIALIPARGGSKGIVRKNMRLVDGKPLIDFTLQAALKSESIDFVYVSSDDDEILAFAEASGAKSMQRPIEFASDSATANEVVEHFISRLPELLLSSDPYIVYLQPTSPLRSSQHIDLAFSQLELSNAHTLVSVVELTKSPYKCFLLNEDEKLASLFDEKLTNARRQDLPKTYMPNGAIYIFRLSDFRKRSGFPSNGSVAFMMNELESIDVDSEADIDYLEYILRKKNG